MYISGNNVNALCVTCLELHAGIFRLSKEKFDVCLQCSFGKKLISKL